MGLALDEPEANEVPVKIEDLDFLISEDIKDWANGTQIEYYQFQNHEWYTVERAGSSSC